MDDNGNVVPEPDLIKWAMWFETATNRVVKQDKIGGNESDGPKYLVSTVFLGLDYGFIPGQAPLLWETMAFKYLESPKIVLGRCFVREPMDGFLNRCSGNREQAEAMHADMVERVKVVEALAA